MQLNLLELRCESLNILSAIIRINTVGKSLMVTLGPVYVVKCVRDVYFFCTIVLTLSSQN